MEIEDSNHAHEERPITVVECETKKGGEVVTLTLNSLFGNSPHHHVNTM